MKLVLGDEVAQFKSLFERSIGDESLVATPKISPSGLDCQVAVWYKLHSTPMIPEERTFESDGYASSGSDRHKAIQNFLASQKEVEWVCIEDFVKEHNLPFEVEYEPEVLDISKKYNLSPDIVCDIIGSRERLLKHKNDLINFKLDGIIKFRGEYYIIEIKTVSDKKIKDAPLEEHQKQGKCYSLLLGIPKIIWIYESRENFKHVIAFQEFEPSEIDDIRKYLNDIVTAKEPFKLKRSANCKFCRYRETCYKDFNKHEENFF